MKALAFQAPLAETLARTPQVVLGVIGPGKNRAVADWARQRN